MTTFNTRNTLEEATMIVNRLAIVCEYAKDNNMEIPSEIASKMQTFIFTETEKLNDGEISVFEFERSASTAETVDFMKHVFALYDISYSEEFLAYYGDIIKEIDFSEYEK